MFHWLRDRRRAKVRKRPFPIEWETFVRANVAHYCVLDAADRSELQAMMQVSWEETHWEGCGGLDLTDECDLIGQACGHFKAILYLIQNVLLSCWIYKLSRAYVSYFGN